MGYNEVVELSYINTLEKVASVDDGMIAAGVLAGGVGVTGSVSNLGLSANLKESIRNDRKLVKTYNKTMLDNTSKAARILEGRANGIISKKIGGKFSSSKLGVGMDKRTLGVRSKLSGIGKEKSILSAVSDTASDLLTSRALSDMASSKAISSVSNKALNNIGLTASPGALASIASGFSNIPLGLYGASTAQAANSKRLLNKKIKIQGSLVRGSIKNSKKFGAVAGVGLLLAGAGNIIKNRSRDGL